MHIGKVTGSTVGWQTLKERAMHGLNVFQEYVTGVFAFLNNFVCVDKTSCESHDHCRGYFCHEGVQSFQRSAEERSNGTIIRHMEDYSYEEIRAHPILRPCNASEEFDRACLYDSSCIAYLLPDDVVELICNCTPGWKGEQCELADMDDSDMAIEIGGFQANFLILMLIYLIVDFGIGVYFSYHARHGQDLSEGNRRPSADQPSDQREEFHRVGSMTNSFVAGLNAICCSSRG